MLLVPPCEPADKLRFVLALIIYSSTRALWCGDNPKYTKFCLVNVTPESLCRLFFSPCPPQNLSVTHHLTNADETI